MYQAKRGTACAAGRKDPQVGADKDINVDVRVVVATNKDLFERSGGKAIPTDLYHRLGSSSIHVPSSMKKRRYSGADGAFPYNFN